MPIEIETIPNESNLFYRVHHGVFDSINKRPFPGAFKDREGAMSTDWDKYSTASDAKNRAKIPSENVIISLNAGKVREIKEPQTVAHSPQESNPAHSNITGIKNTESRAEFTDMAVWIVEIGLPIK